MMTLFSIWLGEVMSLCIRRILFPKNSLLMIDASVSSGDVRLALMEDDSARQSQRQCDVSAGGLL